MVKVRIKICGITNLEDALLAVNLGADALGFVFAKSPRKITPWQAKEIISHLPPSIFSVGVFVNETTAKIKKIVETCRLNAVQLHGEESPAFCRRLKKYAKVIKVFRIKDKTDIKDILKYDVDAYLLDSYTHKIYGGTGKKFNWDLAVEAKKMLKQFPLILSGGLNPANVQEAISNVQPYAIDTSSGVEGSPGKKDKALLEKFIHAIRSLP